MRVHVVEQAQRSRVGQVQAALPHGGRERVGLPVQGAGRVVVQQPAATKVGRHPLDGVEGAPARELRRLAVAGRVVRGGVCAHPVGDRLHQGRPPLTGLPQRPARHGQGRQHVVAVHPDTGDAEPAGPEIDRDAGLPPRRLGDRPVVVLAEEDHRRLEHARPVERLVDITLTGRSVAEVDQGRRQAVAVTGGAAAPGGAAGDAGGGDGPVGRPDRPATQTRPGLLGDPHGVAGRVQDLGTHHDRVRLEAVFVHVPAAVGRPAEQAEDVQRVDAPAPGHRVLAVGREDHVVGAQRPRRADLGRLLPAQARPQAELTLALQGGRLLVEPARDHHVAQEPDQVGVGEVGDVRVVGGQGQPVPVRRQQPDRRGVVTTGVRRVTRDGCGDGVEAVRVEAVCARSGLCVSRLCVRSGHGVLRSSSAVPEIVGGGLRDGCTRWISVGVGIHGTRPTRPATRVGGTAAQ